jgi:hypothetical protein
VAKAKDLVELLLRDHDKVRGLLSRLDSTFDEDLGIYFCKLREEFVRHERAEELILYPALRMKVRGGDAVANECIEEHSRAEETLALLSEQDPLAASFRTRLIALRIAVLAHAKHEEADVFPSLGRHTHRRELAELGLLYEQALEAAPAHPHPHVHDSITGSVVFAPMAAVIDRIQLAMYRSPEGSHATYEDRSTRPVQFGTLTDYHARTETGSARL